SARRRNVARPAVAATHNTATQRWPTTPAGRGSGAVPSRPSRYEVPPGAPGGSPRNVLEPRPGHSERPGRIDRAGPARPDHITAGDPPASPRPPRADPT